MTTTSLLLTLAACGSHGPDGDEVEARGGGVLVTAESVAFAALDIGTDPAASQKVWIQNAGAGPLSVTAPWIEGDVAFSVEGDDMVLDPSGAYAYVVTFDPQTPFAHEAALVFESDSRPSTTKVPLRGEARAPVLEVDRSRIVLGVVDVGCSASQAVVVRNTGNETLDVAPSIVGSSELALESAPLQIAPGGEGSIDISYAPADEGADSATLALDSSDPIQPRAEVEVLGTGDVAVEQSDWFEGGSSSADIVFVVDNSGSMSEEQAGLADSMGAFVDSLNAGSVDYRIGVLTTDTAEFVGEVVTAATLDAAAVLTNQVAALGVGGSGTERGLQMLYDCAQPGAACSEAAGFSRPEALFQGIVVSDEPDQSALAPKSYVEFFWTLRTDPGLVRIDVVAGDFPSPACGTCSAPGYGYDQAQELTGGTYLSVCGDWDLNLSLLGTTAAVARYSLSAAPVVDTIEVFVDGTPAEPGTWTYVDVSDAAWLNVVEFAVDAIPAPGTAIEVRYDVAAVCG